jgi:pyridoxine 5-phosphate synthase
MFVDPDLEQVKESHRIDARAVEINTAAYSDAATSARARPPCGRWWTRRGWGRSWGCRARGPRPDLRERGGDRGRAEMTELNIGHNIVARAALVAWRAVREMVDAIRTRHDGRH